MLSKSISLVSLPLSRQLSPPFGCIRRHHYYPCCSTINQDAWPAWTRRAQPVADPDRRASLRKFSHALNPQSASAQCHSYRAAACIVSLLPRKTPARFARPADCRRRPRQWALDAGISLMQRGTNRARNAATQPFGGDHERCRLTELSRRGETSVLTMRRL